MNKAFENKDRILMHIDDDDDGDWLETAIVSFSIWMTHRFKNLKKLLEYIKHSGYTRIKVYFFFHVTPAQ